VFNWFDVLKIKTPEGEMMVVNSITEYHNKLREELRPIVLEELRLTSERDTEKTKINIKPYRIVDGVRYNASWRDKNSENTHSIDIRYRGSGNENEPHEIISITSDNLGPALQMGTNYEATNSYDLLLEVTDKIEDFYEQKFRTETLGVPSVEEDEDRVSTEEFNRKLEEANPGFKFIEGKLRDLGDMGRLANMKGITLDALLSRYNLTPRDFLDNMTAREIPPQNQPTRRENLNVRPPMRRAPPIRGRRGRREEQ
tara:strand:- start:35218 stop:35985 length:768 start_codon:yes stop_codon:yes gene_type:complete